MPRDFSKGLPRRLRTGYGVVQILVRDDLDDGDMGYTNPDCSKIYVLRGQPARTMVDTVLHELGHVGWSKRMLGKGLREMNPDDVEERIIDQLSSFIVEVLFENPRLARWVAERMRG